MNLLHVRIIASNGRRATTPSMASSSVLGPKMERIVGVTSSSTWAVAMIDLTYSRVVENALHDRPR